MRFTILASSMGGASNKLTRGNGSGWSVIGVLEVLVAMSEVAASYQSRSAISFSVGPTPSNRGFLAAALSWGDGFGGCRGCSGVASDWPLVAGVVSGRREGLGRRTGPLLAGVCTCDGA